MQRFLLILQERQGYLWQNVKPVLRATPGFTLIELLVVIAIIGILASVVLVAVNPAMRIAEAQDSQRHTDLGEVRDSLEAYSTSHQGQYPSTGGTWKCYQCTTYGSGQTATGWIPNLVAEGYIKKLPYDPLTNKGSKYGMASCVGRGDAGYLYRSNGTDYKLLAHCTPSTGLNVSSDGIVCSSKTNFNKLKAQVDPARPTYAYSVYSPGAECW